MNVLFVQQRREVSLFGVFFLLILAVMMWKWVLGAVIAFTLIGAIAWAVRNYRRDQQRQRLIEEGYRARASEQDAWIYRGDPRGMYGHEWRQDEGQLP